jgi:hypothetical protein
MFNDAFEKAQSIPLFDQEDPAALAPAPALEQVARAQAVLKELAAPAVSPEDQASLKPLKDLVDPEYLKATERITKALQALTEEATAAPAPSQQKETEKSSKP